MARKNPVQTETNETSHEPSGEGASEVNHDATLDSAEQAAEVHEDIAYDPAEELEESRMEVFITMNEKREAMSLGPMLLADGSPNPDGFLTVAEYKVKRLGGVAPVQASAAAPVPANDKGKKPPAKAKRYVVLEEKRNVNDRGKMCVMRAGKEISNLNYDIANLRKQGLKLRELSEDDG